MRNLCIVQARMSSSRFPGKVLAPLGESTVLNVLLSRLSKSKAVDKVIIATSTDTSDDVLENIFWDQTVYRGKLLDVRSRFVELANKFDAENIVRITADCPLVCYELIDQMMIVHDAKGSDYTANCNVNPYPKGFDIEIFKSEILLRSDFLTEDTYDKEHVTPWMYSKGGLKVTDFNFSQNGFSKNLNFSVDTPNDLYFLNELEDQHRILNRTFSEIWKLIEPKSP
jgi:spore coat polysaccharide biosynthesis protein SpsF (cytidylyltransferase family)